MRARGAGRGRAAGRVRAPPSGRQPGKHLKQWKQWKIRGCPAQVRGLLKHSRALAPRAGGPPLCALDAHQVAFLAPRPADACEAAAAAGLAALDGDAPGAPLRSSAPARLCRERGRGPALITFGAGIFYNVQN